MSGNGVIDGAKLPQSGVYVANPAIDALKFNRDVRCSGLN